MTKDDIREALTEILLDASNGAAEQRKQLRIDMANFLRNVDGVSLAIEAAEGDADLQQALARNFRSLGGAFQEFAWLLQDLVVQVDQGNTRLDEIRAGQRATDQLIHGLWADVRARLPGRRMRPADVVVSGPPEDATLDDEVLDSLGPCPYPGLAAFGADDAEAGFFRGRQDLTATVVARLAVQAERTGLLMVLGPSGVGKSSLLCAGLLPAVAAGALTIEGSKDWLQLYLHPDRDPATELAMAVSTLAGVSTAGLPAAIRSDPAAFRHAVSQALASRGAERLVLVVDQFEELFTHGCTIQDQQAVIRALLLACRPEVDGRPAPALVVLGMRADFYGHCARIPELAPILPGSQVLVGPMSHDELREAIVKPAEAAGLALEPGLADLLLAEASGESLPLLAHALRQTFEQRRGRVLTVDGYRSTGGIAQAVAGSAEQVYASLDSSGRQVLRQVLLRMVHFGDGVEDTRRRVQLGELTGPDRRQQETVEHVLAELVRQRLVTADHGTYMLSHEALIHAWDRLDGWLSEDREGLRLHRELGNRARAWDRLGRDPGSLYGGAELELTRRWVAYHPDQLDDLEQDFYQASVAAQVAQHRSRRRRSRLLTAIVISQAVLLLVALLAANIARRQYAVAIAERQSAQRAERVALSRQLAAQSATLAGTNPNLAALLAVEAYRTAPSDAALSNLITAASLPLSRRLPHKGLSSVAFSPDGRTLAVRGEDPLIRIWDVSTAKPLWEIDRKRDHSQVFFSADGSTVAAEESDFNSPKVFPVQVWDLPTGRLIARIEQEPAPSSDSPGGTRLAGLSPDGRIVATTGPHGTFQLWNARTGKSLARLRSNTDTNQIIFSPDSRIVAIDDASRGAIALWDVRTGRRITFMPRSRMTLDENRSPVAAFSPDGQVFASARDDDPEVRLWDRRTGRVISLPGHTHGATAVEFSSDGRTIATMADDRFTRIWNVRTGKVMTALSESRDPRYTYSSSNEVWASLVFSPDGRTLATVRHRDGQVGLWDGRTGEHIRTLGGHGDNVSAVVFSPDGNTLATAGASRAAWLWDSRTGRRLRMLPVRGEVHSVVFSPDGRTVATAGTDTPIQLWNTRSSMRITTLTGHRGKVGKVLVSPDGRRLASVGADHDVHIWDGRSGAPATLLEGHGSSIEAAVLSHDGKTLATAGEDATVRLWDFSSRRPAAVLRGHRDGIAALALSPDSRTVVSGSWDHTARLWDARSRKLIAELGGHSSAVLSVAFSSDGRTVATASNDRTARLWNAGTGKLIATLGGHRDGIVAAAFSPDSRYLVTGAKDGTAVLWDVRTQRRVGELTGHQDAITALAFSPRGDVLLSASKDDTVRLWDADRYALVAELSGHRGNITAVDFSPDGRTVATGSADHRVRLWDARTGSALTTITGHTAEVTSVAFYADGRRLATSGGDSTVRLWEAAIEPSALVEVICSAVGRDLTRREWSLYLKGEPHEPTCDEK